MMWNSPWLVSLWTKEKIMAAHTMALYTLVYSGPPHQNSTNVKENIKRTLIDKE